MTVTAEELERVLAELTKPASNPGLNPAAMGAGGLAPGSNAPATDSIIDVQGSIPGEAVRSTLATGSGILPKRLPTGLPFYSSPLRRCRCLAEPLAAALGATALTFDERLAEMNFGNWELKSWDQIARNEIDAWTADLVAYRPGAGETVLEMAHRVRAFHTEILAAQQDAIVICHAGTIRLLLACQRYDSPQDIALHAASTTMTLAYGETVVIECV